MSKMLNGNEAMKLISGFLNTENLASPGLPGASPSGSIWQPYGGFVGGKFYLNAKEALSYSNTSIGTLYEGVYQFVQVDANSGAIAQGTVLFWKDYDNSIVTSTVADATVTGQIAGIALCALTAGNYGYMQVSGKASVKFRAAITKGAPAIGDLVIVDQTPTATGDVLADATTLTSVTAKGIIGVALQAPANGAVKLVSLRLGSLGN